MVHAQNYETVSKFVKVMHRKHVASFSPDKVYIYLTIITALTANVYIM